MDTAAARGVFNDRIGRHPVVVLVDPDSRDIKVYLRRPGGVDFRCFSPGRAAVYD